MGKSTESLLVEVFREETRIRNENGHILNSKLEGDLRFSALMELNGKSHDVYSGSIRSVLAVYYQALLMFPSFRMFTYTPGNTGFLDIRVASAYVLMVPSIVAYLHGKNALAMSTLAQMIGMVLFRRSSSSLVFCLLISMMAVIVVASHLIMLKPALAILAMCLLAGSNLAVPKSMKVLYMYVVESSAVLLAVMS